MPRNGKQSCKAPKTTTTLCAQRQILHYRISKLYVKSFLNESRKKKTKNIRFDY